VYVILFGVGERDTEGIYSLRAFGDDGLPQETIIVFETEEDAQRWVDPPSHHRYNCVPDKRDVGPSVQCRQGRVQGCGWLAATSAVSIGCNVISGSCCFWPDPVRTSFLDAPMDTLSALCCRNTPAHARDSDWERALCGCIAAWPACRYAGLLEATMDHTPNVCSIPPRELLDFCVDQG